MSRTFGISLVLLMVSLAAGAQTGTSSGSGQASQPQVEPMEKTPVFRVEVVTRTTKAVNYRHRGGATNIDFRGTELMPKATGKARVESKTGRLDVEAKFDHLQPANNFGLEYLTYVLWAVTPEGRATNLGEVLLNDGKSALHVTTDLQAFGMIVTAEPYFAVTQPSNVVVLENIIRPDTAGPEEQINARYELLPRGLYTSTLEPIRDAVYGIDRKAPLDLFEARNAVRVARTAKADQYAPASFQKSEQLLRQAEDYYKRKQGRTPIGTVARNAAQTAEEARVMSLRKQQEEFAAKERQAAAEREAKARAEAEAQSARRVQAETERSAAEQAKTQAEQARTQAEQAKAEAERSRAEAETAAQRAAEERASAEAARQAALSQQQQAQAEAEQARLAAQESERQRQKAEADKAELRNRLMQQLNQVLQTRDTARGLIVNMSDVLFETNSYTLRPGARERLAKVAGILLAYPDLRLEVEGHTDSMGNDVYNQRLSEKRAASVRDYLLQQGIPINSIVARGFGKTQPVATNATATGRQLNRRVELVVSGEVIGTRIGGVPAVPGQPLPSSNPAAPQPPVSVPR